jgi:hypothetical protein
LTALIFDIWPESQLPESLLADNFLHKQLVDTSVKTLPKYLLNNGEFPSGRKAMAQTLLTLSLTV